MASQEANLLDNRKGANYQPTSHVSRDGSDEPEDAFRGVDVLRINVWQPHRLRCLPNCRKPTDHSTRVDDIESGCEQSLSIPLYYHII